MSCYCAPDLGEGILKVLVIGGSKVGKTRLINAFYNSHTKEGIYYQNGISWHRCRFRLGTEFMNFALFEIPSDSGFSKEIIRPYYEIATVIVLMYAIDDRSSFEILTDKWLLEVRDILHLKEIPAVLVGNKKDLRPDQQGIEGPSLHDRRFITYQEGSDLMEFEDIKCFGEISSKSLEEVISIFHDIIHLAPDNI